MRERLPEPCHRRQQHSVGDFAIDANRLTGELYNRARLYRAYETLTK